MNGRTDFLGEIMTGSARTPFPPVTRPLARNAGPVRRPNDDFAAEVPTVERRDDVFRLTRLPCARLNRDRKRSKLLLH